MSFDLQMLTDSSSLIDDEIERGLNGFSAEGDAENEDEDEDGEEENEEDGQEQDEEDGEEDEEDAE